MSRLDENNQMWILSHPLWCTQLSASNSNTKHQAVGHFFLQWHPKTSNQSSWMDQSIFLHHSSDLSLHLQLKLNFLLSLSIKECKIICLILKELGHLWSLTTHPNFLWQSTFIWINDDPLKKMWKRVTFGLQMKLHSDIRLFTVTLVRKILSITVLIIMNLQSQQCLPVLCPHWSILILSPLRHYTKSHFMVCWN